MTQRHATVVRAERIQASPEAVFDFLIDPEKMLQWLGSTVDVDPTPGGRFRLSVDGTDNALGTYIDVVRPERVVFTWGWEGSTHVPPGSSTVAVTLIGAGDETIIELRHDGLPSAVAEDHGDGWHYLLQRLAIVALGQDPGPTSP